MTKTLALKTSLIVSALLALPLANAAISKTDYSAGKTRISADYKANKAACDSLKANAKDICVEEAKAKEKVARAELEFNYTGKPADQTKLLETKAKTAYAVAKEKCDDKAGNDKDVCVKEAKAAEVKGLADAKMGKQITEAKKDATADKRDADYKVAAEKCDAMSGDAKNACIASAKARFGKT
ncbi:MAG: hypothetical protein V4792_09390 [Pseudomonadota bacterium]